MSHANILDLISNDIKACELFLKEFPITKNVIFSTKGQAVLFWEAKEKRIKFNSGSLVRKLIEHPLEIRKIVYDYLPQFIKFCIEQEKDSISIDEIKQKHNELREVLRDYGVIL